MLARKMNEAIASGLPNDLLQRNLQRWKDQQLTPGGEAEQ
jgi:polar amino acid transport system substrate-binding protein